MKAFFDSSSLVKKYILEKGSDKIADMISKTEVKIISSICFPEMVSTLSRLKREKRITSDQYNRLIAFIVDDLKNFNVCEIRTPIIRKAVFLLETFTLKTLDALQIACAIEARSEIFISSDHHQIKIAHQAGLKIEEI